MRRSDELAPLSRHHHVALERALALRRADAAGAVAAPQGFVAFLAGAGEAHFRAAGAARGRRREAEEHARLVDEHRRPREHAAQLRAAGDGVTPEAAHATGALLDAHVRWEERELLGGIEARLDPEELAAIGAVLH